MKVFSQQSSVGCNHLVMLFVLICFACKISLQEINKNKKTESVDSVCDAWILLT